MGTDTEQRTTETKPSGTEQLSKDGKGSTSDTSKEGTTPAQSVYDDPKFHKAVETAAFRVAQSMIDKALEKQKKEQTARTTKSQEDEMFDRLLRDGNEDAGKVMSLREVALDTKKKREQAEVIIAEAEQKQAEVMLARATKILVSKLYPDQTVLLTKAEQLISDSEGNPRLMELLAEKYVADYGAELRKVNEVPKVTDSPKRPDSGSTVISGGKLTAEDTKGMSTEQVLANYKEIAKLPLTV